MFHKDINRVNDGQGLQMSATKSIRSMLHRWPGEGYWADIVVFDADKIQDNSTYKDPHHYATGIPYVLVNGIPVIKNGEHTGAKAGQALRHICAPR